MKNINQLINLIVLALCLLIQPGCAAAAQAQQQPPNIVIIFTDDMGYADLSCYGSTICTTPNLDRLAERGMRFTDFYVTTAVCSASRSSLMTGLYPPRAGISGALGPRNEKGLDHRHLTIAELVKQRGYATACIGKWHLGHTPDYLPVAHGFDEYFGLPYSNDMWPYHYGDHDRGHIGSKNRNDPPLPLIDGVETIETNPRQASLTPRYTERALDFIDRNKDQPFFLYLAHSHPHVPIAASDKFKGSTGNGLYADMIAEIDDSVGQVIKRLEQHGLTNNTLVFFSSDNGPWTKFGNEAGETGPLRGDKGTTFEGGQRVPGIFVWPGTIPAGVVTDALASTLDLLPTVAAATGATLPDTRLDGHDILPLLKGETDRSPTQAFFYIGMQNTIEAVRVGDWKLHIEHKYRRVVTQGKDGQPGKQDYPTLPLSLFNLKDDIGESTNLAEANPKIVEALQDEIERGNERMQWK
ncbi:MAG: sulfatase family protein [Phycisphaeraceae bacterium]